MKRAYKIINAYARFLNPAGRGSNDPTSSFESEDFEGASKNMKNPTDLEEAFEEVSGDEGNVCAKT